MYELVYLIDSILGQHKEFAKSEFYYYCPLCNHHNAKLAVNISKRKWHCWKCGAAGRNLFTLFRKVGASKEDIQELATLLDDEIPHKETVEIDVPPLTLPLEYQPLWEPCNSQASREAMAYLKKRNITTDDIIRYRIGFCSDGMYRGRVIIPSYDSTNKLNYFVGRTYWKTNSWNYLTPSISKNIVAFENQIDWSYPITLTEGVFDAIATKRNSIPLMGKFISRKLKQKILQNGPKEIYIALDNDAMRDTLKIAEKYMKEDKVVYVVELSGKDPSDIGFVQMQYLIKTAKKVTFAELIKLKLSLI